MAPRDGWQSMLDEQRRRLALETENALRGDKLLPTLERVLDERARESSAR